MKLLSFVENLFKIVF